MLGPTLRVAVPNSMKIEPAAPALPAIDRLKNYDKSKIDVSKVENMHCFTYTPPIDSSHNNDLDDKELKTVMNDMFAKLQACTPDEFAAVFDTSVSNCDVPDAGGVRTGARVKLRSVANTVYSLADKLGHDGA